MIMMGSFGLEFGLGRLFLGAMYLELGEKSGYHSVVRLSL